MRAGTAQADITPDIESHKTLEKNSLDIQNWKVAIDPLFAKALVIENDGKKICIVQVDLNAVDNRCTAEIRRAAAQQCGFEEEAILVHATQTHSAPQLGYRKNRSKRHRAPAKFWDALSAGDDRYREFAVERIIEAVVEADGKLAPASVGIGRAVEGRVAFNRRMVTRSGGISMPLFMDRDDSLFMEGPIDPELGVMTIVDNSRDTIGVLLNYTCHPVNLHPERFLTTISADWPGALAAEMKKTLGEQCIPLVLNGPCGNINPWNPWDPDYVRDHVRDGKLLAGTAGRIIESIEYRKDLSLDWRLENVKIPWRVIDPNTIKEAKEYLAEHPEPLWADETKMAIHWRWTYYASLLDFDEQRREHGDYDYEIQVLRVGDLAIVGLPGEPFVEVGLRIKLASPAANTMVLSNPRWWEGAYIPTARAYERGGYETEDWIARLAPEALDTIGAASIRMLKEMW